MNRRFYLQMCSLQVTALTGLWLAIAVSVSAAAEPLRVGTSGDYAPFSSTDNTGARRGFDIDLAQRLGHDLHRKVVFVTFRWPELTAALRENRFDLAASGVTIRTDRLLAGRFTRPYALSGAQAVIRAADAGRYPKTAALDHGGVHIIVNRGGHLEAVASATFPHARIDTTGNNLSLGPLVAEGRDDAALTDSIEARHIVREHPDLVALPPFTFDRKALYVRADQPALLNAVDHWLAAREADGWLNALRRRWFGPDAEIPLPRARIEAVVSLVDQRMRLMPMVAAAKRRSGRAIDDPAQEKRVLEAVRSGAGRAGLNREHTAALFEVLIDAAKAVEHASPPDTTAPELEHLRSELVVISGRLIAEIAADRETLRDPAQTPALREGLSRTDLPGLDAATRQRLADALAGAAR